MKTLLKVEYQGLGLKIIEDTCRLLAITYELHTNDNGTGFLFSKE